MTERPEVLQVARFLFVHVLSPEHRTWQADILQVKEELLTLWGRPGVPWRGLDLDKIKAIPSVATELDPTMMPTALFVFIFLHPDFLRVHHSMETIRQKLLQSFPEQPAPNVLVEALQGDPNTLELAESLMLHYENLGLLIERLREEFAKETKTILSDNEDAALLEMYQT